MKLTEIRIKNFRSIIDTKVVPINQVTVIVGKNNQGKSNFIKAIDVAFQSLSYFSSNGSMRIRRSAIYDYERDFPLYDKCSSRKTEISLKLTLSEEESVKLFSIIENKISDYINVIVTIDENSRIEIKFSKRGASGLNEHIKDISVFILDNINFINIHAVRTENDSISVINQLIQNRMKSIDEDKEYIEAMTVINKKEQEVLNEISNSTLASLKTFLHEVENVEISVDDYRSRSAGFNFGRRFSMKIDDGISTDLQYKGDGIKSLTALALLKDNDTSSSTSIIAIEEPESHLHSGAIHNLNDILRSISNTTQLLITTHNPLFISRNSLNSNVIIRDNTVYIPTSIKDLRDELGVLASDNLLNAELVIIVEGDSDVKILEALIKYHDKKLSDAIDNNRLIFKSVNGASKINQDIYYFKNMMCRVLVILDNDNAAREALKVAQDKNLIEPNEYNVIRKESNADCEIEDFIEIEIYKDTIEKDYGVSLNHSKFKGNKKWSDRLRNTFTAQAKLYNEDVEKEIKIKLANAVKKSPNSALNSYHLSIFNHIIKNIYSKLD